MPTSTILLIDDERDLLLGLAALLRRAGYQTITASNSIEGLHLAQTHSPDLIVCDVMMPAPNGLELRTQLASNPQLANIPFVFLTARAQQHDKNVGLGIGADDYITKPFDRQEFLLRIQAVLRRQSLGRQAGWEDSQNEIEQFKQNIIRTFNQEFRTPLPVILATLETVLHRSFEQAPERSQMLIKSALNNTEEIKAIIQDLVAMGDPGHNPTLILRDPIDIQLDFIWPIQELVGKYASKELSFRLILEPDVRNWATLFRNAPVDDETLDTRIVVRAPREEFTRAVLALVKYNCAASPVRGIVQANLAYNGFGGCLFTVSGQGANCTPEMSDDVFPTRSDLTQTRKFARSLGGDLVLLDAVAGCRMRMILPPGK